MEHESDLTAESLWGDVAARLRGSLNEKTYGNWFAEVGAVRLDDETFVLAVPNDFTREWIESRFADLIRAVVRDATGGDRRLQLVVQPAPNSARKAAARRCQHRESTGIPSCGEPCGRVENPCKKP